MGGKIEENQRFALYYIWTEQIGGDAKLWRRNREDGVAMAEKQRI